MFAHRGTGNKEEMITKRRNRYNLLILIYSIFVLFDKQVQVTPPREVKCSYECHGWPNEKCKVIVKNKTLNESSLSDFKNLLSQTKRVIAKNKVFNERPLSYFKNRLSQTKRGGSGGWWASCIAPFKQGVRIINYPK